LSATYDSLEKRIEVLMEQEELSKIRPDLDGAQVMQLLNLKPSREVGQAMDFLMELRLEQGPVGEEAATKALLEWWASR
jgi:poly(A) polymerase